MILSWYQFNESIKVKGLKKKINKRSRPHSPSSDDMFRTIHITLKEAGKTLKGVIISVAEKLNLKGKIKAFKGGSNGVTFLAGDKTIKITSDKTESKMIHKIMQQESKENLTHIIKYYDIYELKIAEIKTKYWVILMEKITPIYSDDCDEKILKFFEEYLYGGFVNVTGHTYSDKNGYDGKFYSNSDVDKITKHIVSNVKKDKKFNDKFIKYVYDMGEIVKNYNSLKIDNNDIHEGNIGINSKGRLVSFDPTGGETKSGKIKMDKLKV